MKTTPISVIVLAHDKSSLTRRCLEALLPSRRELEVVLVDNASTDDTPTLAREYEAHFAAFRYHRSPRNLSFAVANNGAARGARGQTLLFLNNDVIVGAGAVESLVEHARTGSPAGAVAGARLLFPGMETIQHAGMRQMLWGYVSNLGTLAPRGEPALNRAGEIFAVTGAMLALPRLLFAGIGGFDERYRWGYEDVDLCLKARSSGAPVQYVPAAEAVHVESATLHGVRQPQDLAWNYGLYRRKWNHLLVPNEQRALSRLQRQGLRRVVIFGTGLAARGLFRFLHRNGIIVEAFTASAPCLEAFCGRPVVTLEHVQTRRFDRLAVATQQYHALRERLAPLDPTGMPLFPTAEPGDQD